MEPRFDNEKYIRIAEAASRLKISRSTLYKWIETVEGFPQPIKAGPRVVLMDAFEIAEFVAARAVA